MTAQLARLGGRASGRVGQWALLLLLLVALMAAIAWRTTGTAEARRGYAVPHSAGVENSLGIRVTSVSLVGDGGLVEVAYTVLNTEKASRFQSDTQHPPVLTSDKRSGSVYRAALMKQGHSLLPGQTYYLLYENNHNDIHVGDTIAISSSGGVLSHVPVR